MQPADILVGISGLWVISSEISAAGAWGVLEWFSCAKVVAWASSVSIATLPVSSSPFYFFASIPVGPTISVHSREQLSQLVFHVCTVHFLCSTPQSNPKGRCWPKMDLVEDVIYLCRPLLLQWSALQVFLLQISEVVGHLSKTVLVAWHSFRPGGCSLFSTPACVLPRERGHRVKIKLHGRSQTCC